MGSSHKRPLEKKHNTSSIRAGMKRIIKDTLWAILLIFILLIGSKWVQARPPIQVAVSIPPQAYFVKQVGGNQVRVIILLPPGANPATFEPKATTLLSLSRAKIYFRIHVPFEEAWMNKFRAVNRRMKVVDTTREIKRINNDPHVWLAPLLVKIQAKTICEEFKALDPAGRENYERNLRRFNQSLDELSARINRLFRNLKRRTILVYHPCWGYFAKEFGLTQIAIERGGKAPGAAAMAEIMKSARLHGIHCVFAQPQFDTKSAQIIARQINGRLVLIDPLAEKWDLNLLNVAGKMADCLREGN